MGIPGSVLRKMIKSTWRQVREQICRVVGPIAFDRSYLAGRHFKRGGDGWGWVWRSLWFQKVLGFNRHIPWPTSPFMTISDARLIEFYPDDLNNFQMWGSYFDAQLGHSITIGQGSYISANVGLITTKHDCTDPDKHDEGGDIVLGRKCWIGMNAVILPGVVLGDHTIVGAGAVVTKSFPQGGVVLAGVPARVIRTTRDEQEAPNSVNAHEPEPARRPGTSNEE